MIGRKLREQSGAIKLCKSHIVPYRLLVRLPVSTPNSGIMTQLYVIYT